METFLVVLKILGYVWLVFGAISIVFMVAIAVDDVLHWRRVEQQEKAYKAKHGKNETPIEKAKRELLEEKEREALENNFFQDDFFRGFRSDGNLIHRGHKVPTDKALDYYRQMEDMDDTQNIKVFTEEI